MTKDAGLDDRPAAAGGTAMPRLELRGRPRLVRGDGSALVLSDKDAALLALVALEMPVARNRVASLLWPAAAGGSGARAQNNLRQRLFRLGRWAGADVVAQGPWLRLADGVASDLADGDDADLVDDGAGELLATLEVDPASDLGLWVQAARQRWRSTRDERLVALAERLEAQGRHAEALRLAARRVALAPLSEHACRLLMRLHHARGDRGAALAEFERCRRALYEQLGDAPTQETVELAQAIAGSEAPAPGRRLALPLALRHPPRTVGRDAALQRAEHRWAQLGVVVVLGAAGIGKSRLAAELQQRFGIGVSVLCRPESAASSFGLLGLVAAALAPAVRDRLAPEQQVWLDWLADPLHLAAPLATVQPGKVAQVFGELLAQAADAGIGALALEDLHHADDASLQVLCANLPEVPAGARGRMPRWLLSCRDNELPRPLQAWIERRPLGADPVVPLAPLDVAATAEFLATIGLADGRPDAAAALHAHCGGHPLYMLQVLRQLQLAGELDGGGWPARLPLPDDAMVSASQRLTRADPTAQQMAYLAALCGPDFTPDLMCRLMGQGAVALLAPWRRLEELHIFGPAGFAHDLVREAVLAVVPRPLEPLLHREIAQALHDTGADPLRRALHWEAGGEPARAAREFEAAAAVAERCGLQQQALQWLARAQAQHRAAGEAAAAFDCDWRRGHLMVAAAPIGEALLLARRLPAEARTPAQQAQAAELMSRVKIEQQDPSALADAEEALALAETLRHDPQGPALVARSRLVRGCALSLQGRHEDALAEFDRIAAETPLDDDDHAFDLACDRASVLATLGRRDEAVAVQQRVLERALAQRHLARASFAAGFCATHLGYLCRVTESVALAEQSIALARQAGSEQGQVLVDEMGRAGNLGDIGRYDEALALGEQVLAALQAGGQALWAANAAHDRAVIFMRLGRPDLAQQLLGPLPDGLPAWVRASRRLVQARLRQWQGRDGRALVLEAAAMFGEAGGALHDYPRRKIELEAARARGAAEAVSAARDTVAWARAHRHVAFERHARAVLIGALGEVGRAAEAADEARELAAQDGIGTEAFGYYLPQLLLACCEALQAVGDTPAAAALLDTAIAWLEDRSLRHVPPLFRASFMTRNPVNQRLIELRRRAVTPG